METYGILVDYITDGKRWNGKDYKQNTNDKSNHEVIAPMG